MKKNIYIILFLAIVVVTVFSFRSKNSDNINSKDNPIMGTSGSSDDASLSKKTKKHKTPSSASRNDSDGSSEVVDSEVESSHAIVKSKDSDSDSDTDEDTDDSSPLSDAVLLLRASHVSPDWLPSDVWENEGTLGSVADAEVRDSVNVPFSHVVIPEYLPSFANGPGFKIEKPEYAPQYHGFVIPDNDALDIPNTGALTLIFDVSLIDPDDPTNKLAQKYPNVDLGSSEEGWILENINLGEYEGSISLVNASNDGSGFAGIFAERRTTTDRFTVAIRWDRDADTLRMFINGVEDYVQGNPTLTTLDDVNTAADLVLCGGNVFHNVAIFDRAVSDSDIAKIDQIFRN